MVFILSVLCFEESPIVCCCMILIPMAIFFEYGAYWSYYVHISGILRPISISWSILTTLILVIPYICIMIVFQSKLAANKHVFRNNEHLARNVKLYIIITLFLLLIFILSINLVMNTNFLDPNYIFDMKIFLFFTPALLIPFAILIHKLLKYYCNFYDIATNYDDQQVLYLFLNDVIFLLFAFKLSSLFLIPFIISVVITTSNSTRSIATIFCIISVFVIMSLWIITGKISTTLYQLYQKHSVTPGNTASSFIRPLIPFGNNNGYQITLKTDVSSKKQSFFRYILSLWRQHTFWFRHILLIITCLLTIFTAYFKYQNDNNTDVRRYALTTIIAASFPIFLSVYSVIIELNSSSNEYWQCRKSSYCFSTDVKYRGMILTKTLLFMLKNYLIEHSGSDVLGYSFTILSFSTLLFIAIITWAAQSEVLMNLPIKNPKYFRITYLISYVICKISSFFVVVNSFINCTYIPCTSFVGNIILPFMWILWSKLYNNEVARFTSELRKINNINNNEHNKNEICGKIIMIESFPCTLGALYQLQCMIIIGSFVTLLICSFNVYEIYIDSNKVGVDYEAKITVFFHIFFAFIAFINAIVAYKSTKMDTNSMKGNDWIKSDYKILNDESMTAQL